MTLKHSITLPLFLSVLDLFARYFTLVHIRLKTVCVMLIFNAYMVDTQGQKYFNIALVVQKE